MMNKNRVLPLISMNAIKAWRSAGLRVYLTRVKGGYTVRVEGQ
jgi:hypothetical protein